MYPIITFISTLSTKQQMEVLIEKIKSSIAEVNIEHYVLNEFCNALDIKTARFLKVASTEPSRFIIVTFPKFAMHHQTIINIQKGIIIDTSYRQDVSNFLPMNHSFQYVIDGHFDEAINQMSVVPDVMPMRLDDILQSLPFRINEIIHSYSFHQYPISSMFGSAQCKSLEDTLKNMETVDMGSNKYEPCEPGFVYTQNQYTELTRIIDLPYMTLKKTKNIIINQHAQRII